jgi:hypothetical protein
LLAAVKDDYKSSLQGAGGMALAVEHLPSKWKTLSSNSTTTKKKKKFINSEKYK